MFLGSVLSKQRYFILKRCLGDNPSGEKLPHSDSRKTCNTNRAPSLNRLLSNYNIKVINRPTEGRPTWIVSSFFLVGARVSPPLKSEY